MEGGLRVSVGTAQSRAGSLSPEAQVHRGSSQGVLSSGGRTLSLHALTLNSRERAAVTVPPLPQSHGEGEEL